MHKAVVYDIVAIAERRIATNRVIQNLKKIFDMLFAQKNEKILIIMEVTDINKEIKLENQPFFGTI